jgi:hypothetical protein
MKQPTSLVLCSLCVASAALSACSSQVDPEYRGEPLAVISGAVSADDVGVDGLVPVLGWYNFGRSEDEETSDATPTLLHEVQVEGEFPNRFTMRVYDLPPEKALLPAQGGEPATGIAMVFAADPDADWSEGFENGMGDGEGEWRPKWLAGAALNYMILYLDGPTGADGPAARAVGMPLAKGYHLLKVREHTPDEEQERFACQEASALRAIAAYNEMFGTDHADTFGFSDEEYAEYEELEDRENATCGGKLHMEVVPSGLDHPVQLHIGPDLEFLDWT